MGKSEVFLTNNSESTGYSSGNRMNTDLLLYTHTNLGWTINLNMKARTVKLLYENIGEYLGSLG